MDVLKNAQRVGARATACVAAIVAMAFAPQAPADTSLEYAVKAAYLSKFGIFVDWPKSAFETPQSPVVLCVAGQDPFDGTLDKVVEGQHIGEHPLTIRRMKTVTRNSGCDILYAGGSDEQPIDQALAAVNGTNVLTVTDTAGRGQAAGIVDFVIQNNRVRFNIDDRAAAQNGIIISSHLLSLALSVRPRN
ncbi:MAG TPA: YfiR family protein [Rhizomicrobium sp.]|nr:YfiR family protein [Rhizomicrobium sp.]